MRLFYPLTILLFISATLSAQFNLVPNYSFEDYNACPVSYSAFSWYDDTYVDDWYAGSSGTSDYFNACADISTQVSVPENLFSEDQPAHTGDAYAGFWTYFAGDFGPSAYREYAQIELKEAMVAGECYYVEFWCAPATQSDVSSSDHATTDAVGAYFAEDKIGDGGSYGVLDVTPQIENNGSGNYIDHPGDWTRVCGFFAAAGGEQWICIGNYHADVDVVAYDGGSVSASSVVYLFLDDVLVTPLDSLIAAFLKDTVVCAPITLSAPTCGDSYLWSTGETTPEITVTESGDYWLQIETSCGTVSDTAEIIFVIDSTITSATDINICFTDLPYEIPAFAGYDFYDWSTGEHTPSITVDEGGTYYVSGFADCKSFVDTFNLHVTDPLGLVLDLGNDTLICAPPGWSLQLSAPDGYTDYAWSTGETNSSISVNEPGTYSVTITTSCETFTDEIEVTEDPYFGSKIELGPDIELCPPAGINNVVLTATEGLPNYEWNTGEQTNSIIASAPGTYWVVSDLLCADPYDSVRITLCNDIYLPNAFSPNGDGINDKLQLIIVDPSRLIAFQIYNRWGETVFDGNAASYEWDGMYNGTEQPMGVYAYYIRFKDDAGLESVMQGNVTLVK